MCHSEITVLEFNLIFKLYSIFKKSFNCWNSGFKIIARIFDSYSDTWYVSYSKYLYTMRSFFLLICSIWCRIFICLALTWHFILFYKHYIQLLMTTWEVLNFYNYSEFVICLKCVKKIKLKYIKRILHWSNIISWCIFEEQWQGFYNFCFHC